MIENKFLLGVKSVLMKRAPSLLYLGSRMAARTVLYGKERDYCKGSIEGNQDLRSVLYFSTVRCGSQFIGRIIARLYEDAGGTFVNLPNYVFHAFPRDPRLRVAETARSLFKNRGFFFGAVGPIEGEFRYEDYTLVVGVRDPRDILVSGFYSLAYAHTPMDKKFADDSREAREKGLEWFVRQEFRIGMVKEAFDFFGDHLVDRPNCLLIRYEDIMNDFSPTISGLAGHVTGGEINQDLLDALAAEHAQTHADAGTDENPLRHRRSGKSGQFREKLRVETSEFLTEEFGEFLDAFGYER